MPDATTVGKGEGSGAAELHAASRPPRPTAGAGAGAAGLRALPPAAMPGGGPARATQERRPHLPIVVLAGEPSLADAIAAIRHGVVDFLIKPASTDDLMGAIRRAAMQHGLQPVSYTHLTLPTSDLV